MNKELLEEYAQLKIKEKELAARIKELGPEIKAMIEETGADKVDMEVGTFTITVRKTWNFSDLHSVKKTELKDLEEREKADGTAEFEEETSLMFKEKKV